MRRRNRAPSLRSSASNDPVRSRFEIQRRNTTFAQQPRAGYSNHGPIVGAVANRGDMDGYPLVAPASLEARTKLRVGGHAARHHNVAHAAALGGDQRFLH